MALWLTLAVSATTASASDDGGRLYETLCAGCHGASGIATPTGRVLGAIDLSDPERQDRLDDAALRRQIRDGSANRRMPGFAAALGDAQLAALVTHVRSLRRAGGSTVETSMNAYSAVKLVHVLTAVVAMGLVTAGAILGRRRRGVPIHALHALARWSSVGLAAMIATGIALDYLADGALHGMRWFRIGILWSVVGAIAMALARRWLGRGIADTLDPDRARRRALVASSIAVACVVLAVVVMVQKP